MRSSSSLSPRVVGVSLFVLALIATPAPTTTRPSVKKLNATGNALAYSTYLGSGHGGSDTTRGIAVDSIGNGYVTEPGRAAWTILNNAANTVGQGAPSNSATATPTATLLAQFSQQGPKLVGTDGVGIGEQGYSVSISADGNTAIVGGFRDNSNAGAMWVWTRSGGVWTQQGTKLVGSGAVGPAYQGFSVSISADGNTAIVGGFGDNSFAGAAWIWTRSGGVWSQQGIKLVGSGGGGVAVVPRGSGRGAEESGRSREPSWSARAPWGTQIKAIPCPSLPTATPPSSEG